MTRRAVASIALAVGTFALTGVAPGQVVPSADRSVQREEQLRQLTELNIDRRLKANEMVPLDERLLVDFGAYTSFDYLSSQDYTLDTKAGRQTSVVGYGRLNLDGAQELFLRGRWGYNDYNDGDSFDGRGSREVDEKLDRAYYRLDIGRAITARNGKESDSNLTIQVGRDFAYWANGLVLGTRLDGAVADFTAGPLTVQALAGITPKYTVDFDASRPDYDIDTKRAFYGLLASVTMGDHQPFIYALSQRDENLSGPADIGSIQTRYHYNSYYLGIGSSGSLSDRLLYSVEATYEGGKSTSNSFKVEGASLTQVPQTLDEIQAWAVNGRIEYLFPGDNKSRFAIEETIASADADRGSPTDTFNGNAPNTVDRSFNSFGLINTGLEFAPSLGNLSTTRVGFSTYPMPGSGALRRLQVGVDFFAYMKVQEDAAVDEQTTDGRLVGVEPDLFATWQATSDLTFVVRYGVFFPGNIIVAEHDPRQFIFLGVTYAF